MNLSLPESYASSISVETTHLQRLQCSRQWRGFLVAMADEFVSALPAQELATLMARIGVRFAAGHPLPACETVQGLQQEMNRVWDLLEWGWAELYQTGEGMEVVHHFSPLTAAFGQTQVPWACGFLQGVYQHWFAAAGAEGLRVDVVSTADAQGTLRLRLVAA